MPAFPVFSIPTALALALAAAAASTLLIVALRPLLQRYALARPNARSSHKTPTAQGGGIAVIAAALACAAVAMALLARPFSPALFAICGAAIMLACLGALDDLRPMPALPRLAVQFATILLVVGMLAPDLRLVPALPLWIERTLLLIAGLWFINLVNFMDGLDWMSVAEIVPVTLALCGFGIWGKLPWEAAMMATALGGALLGFAPFNRPVARLFLGDVGSLPIGLITGWCLLELAGQQHFAAALLLPLYYLADGTLTLLRRMKNREPFWLAHRSHFYQQATDNGFTVPQVIGEVFALNIVLAILATLSIAAGSYWIDFVLICAGSGAVGFVLTRFSRRRASLI